ncbi:MAG TPA: GNAT family N-acetyltransferase [Vicinamibacteria bacterium]
MLTLATPRLELVAATAALARAAASDRAALARLLSARVPASWPHELVADNLEGFARRIEADAALEGWLPWYWVAREDRTLIGNGGFGAVPAEDGSGKIGYAIVAEYEGRGFATEAVAAILEWAFAHPGLTRVVADTYPELGRSIRVLQKNGFRYAGPGKGERVIRYELTRGAWLAAVS